MTTRKVWWMALAAAPTETRKHRTLVADGSTEEAAILAVTEKLMAEGRLAGEIKTLGPLGPEDRA